MSEALKHSTEPLDIKEMAKKKVTGLIGNIRQKRRMEAEVKAAKESQALRQSGQSGSNFTPIQHTTANRQAASRMTNGGGYGKENRMTELYAPPPPYRQ